MECYNKEVEVNRYDRITGISDFNLEMRGVFSGGS